MYDKEIDLKIKLHQYKDKIQCVVTKNFIENIEKEPQRQQRKTQSSQSKTLRPLRNNFAALRLKI